MAKEFEIVGLKKLMVQLETVPKVLAKKIDAELDASAKQIVRNAKNDAPTDMGDLKGGISSFKVDSLQYEIVSNAFYSPYIEWGTGKKVSIPADQAEFAAQFKGKSGGGNVDDFFANILDWVRRKGLSGTYSVKTKKRTGKVSSRDSEDFDVAWLIFMSILKNGVTPHPFFFHNFLKEKPELIKRIKAIVEEVK